MSTELWYPIPTYHLKPRFGGLITTVRKLCATNNIQCRFEGVSAHRVIRVVKSRKPFIECAPNQGPVCIGTRYPVISKAAQEYALSAMAYAVFDLVARESVRGIKKFSQIRLVGRPRSGRIKSNAERQREYRERHPPR